MAQFSISNSSGETGYTGSAITTTFKSQVLVVNSSNATYNLSVYGAPTVARRFKMYDLLLGTNGTPADNYMTYDVARVSYISSTATPTTTVSSISSAFMLDQADPGFALLAVVNSTSETGNTFVAEPWFCAINQRASYRWVCAPGSEIVSPANIQATSPNGLDLRALSGAYTGTVTMNGWFWEL